MCVEKEGKEVFSEMIQDFGVVLSLCWGFFSKFGAFWWRTGSARLCAAQMGHLGERDYSHEWINQFLCSQIPDFYSWDLLTNGIGQAKGAIRTLKFILVAA